MKRFLTISCVVFFAISFFSVCHGLEGEPIIGRVSDWAPHYYKENGKWKGISVDTYRALADEAGISLVLNKIPWSRAMKYMGFRPIMIGNLNPTSERQKLMYFFGPHHEEIMGVAISVKYKDVKINTLDDLASLADRTGLQIIFQQDVFYSNEFNSRIESDPGFAEHFKKKVMKINESIRLISESRYLGFIEDKSGLDYLIKLKKLTDQVVIHDYVLSRTDVYVGVSKTISNDMYQKLKAADKRLKAKGVYKFIQNKWLPAKKIE